MAKRTVIPRLGPISSLFEAMLDRDRTSLSTDAPPKERGAPETGKCEPQPGRKDDRDSAERDAPSGPQDGEASGS